MFPDTPFPATAIARRAFLHKTSVGLGAFALQSMFQHDATGAGVFGSHLHLPARCKRVIHLCMAGGPSHLETFDWKPELRRLHGQPFPESFTKGQQLAQLQNMKLTARGSFVDFEKCGKSGIEISALFPNIKKVADELCVVRSLHTEQINHDPAHTFFNTGSLVKGRPSMGSWLLYGLGSETQDLPGYVVLVSSGPDGDQPISSRQWSSGFLATRYQGVQFQSRGAPVHYLNSPTGWDQNAQRKVIDEIKHLNQLQAVATGDPEALTRIAQYEMAFQMQSSVPELADMKSEPQHVLDLYGVKQAGDGTYASNCLLARRLAERGVRFIQLYHRGWDQHRDIEKRMPIAAKNTDQATAALIMDLKQRGMLDDTLIVWAGEFGRTPMGQEGSGRDHHINAFSIFLAGGGVRPGTVWGSTDELGYKYLPDGQDVHVHDLHATMLHLCGIDHSRFTYKHQGLDFKLTGVEAAKVVKGIIA